MDSQSIGVVIIIIFVHLHVCIYLVPRVLYHAQVCACKGTLIVPGGVAFSHFLAIAVYQERRFCLLIGPVQG